MSHNKIVIGSREFLDEAILDGNCFIGSSLVGDELSIDTLGATLDNSRRMGTLFVPKGASGLLTSDKRLFYVRPIIRVLVDDMILYGYGEAVYYYHDDSLIGKFYMASCKRVGKYNFEITCTSAIGLLDGDTHYGGLYAGTLAGTILADIIGGMVEYAVDPVFAAVPVYGWLPVGTRRENLHQLLFAVGGSLKKTSAGVINITFLDSKSPYDISDDRLGLGGSVNYQAPVSGVAVTEHGYGRFATDEEVTLYDGQLHAEAIVTPKGTAVSGVLVTFSDPVHDLAVADGTILESGVNYAVLGGSYATLTGKKYTHTTRVITRRLSGGTDNMARVEDATLVSLVNSGNVADRLLSYYSAARVVSMDMIVGPERPGDAVAFNDPFDDPSTGLMQSQDINISNTLVAAAKIVCGYVPSGGGNNFKNSAVVGHAGNWIVPAGVKKIRVVLISGGAGGYSGEKGEDGKSGAHHPGRPGASTSWDDYAYGLAGKGGNSGAGGPGGRVKEIDLDVTPGQTFAVAPGAGGPGGASSGASTPGSTGTDTTFGPHSSADGAVYAHGYTELFSGKVYARPGNATGVTGGTGSGADTDDFKIVPGDTLRGPAGETWGPGGAGNERSSIRDGISATSMGGPGGGAAYGVPGGIGGSGEAWISGSSDRYQARVVGGPGGQGAKPIAQAAQTEYGCGGNGGHGGGGGGGGGAAGIQYNSGTSVSAEVLPGPGGSGGIGGDGGQGGPGCVIIYW